MIAARFSVLMLPVLLDIAQVRTSKIHIFTVIQTLSLAFLVAVKLTPLAPSFPFFIMCLIPLRKLLTKFYTEEELEEVSFLLWLRHSLVSIAFFCFLFSCFAVSYHELEQQPVIEDY